MRRRNACSLKVSGMTMGEFATHFSKLPPEQEAIRAKCFHPTGRFVEFKKDDIERSISARFETIVQMYSDRMAVKSANQVLTYDELNKAANIVARVILAECGEGNEPVALLFDHGAAAITSTLAGMKAGKICVPLDSSFPISRLLYILEDSQAGLIVTNQNNISLAGELARRGQRLLNIDTIESDRSCANLDVAISPKAFASILYTSGSTGEPKGVLHSHHNLLQNVLIHTNDFHVSCEDRVTLVYSFSFSAFLKSILCALLNGALLLPFDVKREGVGRLAKWLIEEKVTIYFSIGSLLLPLIHALRQQTEKTQLRALYLASEAVNPKVVELYKQHLPSSCIIAYCLASNETGTSRRYFIDKETEISNEILPVGYAVPGKEIVLLDDERKIVECDNVGEIAVRSRYLATGYWQRADLTEAKFIPDPDGGDARLYLTGDLGRMGQDGCLELLGRKDFMVKIRGYRVELAEIERSLVALDTIVDAIVVARVNQTGDTQLVAYVVPADQIPTVSALRRALAKNLPDYMIPSIYVLLDALPLTPNGKVDRRALPEPGNGRPELGTPHVLPRTPIEAELAKVWAEALSLDQVGVYDNFFDLGGHSLTATRVLSQVIEKFRTEISLQSVFQSPTIAAMAEVIAQSQAKKLDQADLNRILAELESLSDEQARQVVANERGGDVENRWDKVSDFAVSETRPTK
jgi:amino acid adenylation domain-containing protein